MCVKVTDEFLQYSLEKGNDLITPMEEYGFPGLKHGDKWCVCALRWKEALDAGAGGLIIPMIESADQLKNAIDYSKWPPSGNRGVGFSRANLFGKNFDKYVEEAQQPIIVAMIENINAVNELDNILKRFYQFKD